MKSIYDALGEAIRALEDEIQQLYSWVEESKTGGWSTHQVNPMMERAGKLSLKVRELRRIREINA
jgi:hypothetical protein